MSDRPAVAGGTPVRATLLPFARYDFGAAEEAAVIAALRSGWITTGPRVAELEAALRDRLAVPHALGVASCTAGLHLLLRAAGVGPGDEVITSPMSFPATANAILHAGARPVIADVLPNQLTVDPDAVAAAIGPATKAILPVHYAGWPCAMDALNAIAQRHGLAVIEDAAHGLGATYRGRAVGALGDGAAFSFYATKNLTTGEGGLVTTPHAEWAGRMRIERLHGVDLDATRRDGLAYEHWEAVSLGWKANLTDIAAALGLAQLQRFDDFLARRRALDRRYRAALSAHPAVQVIEGPAEAESAAHLFPLLLRPEALRLDRDGLLSALLAERIGVGVHFRALPLHRFFRDTLGWTPAMVPVASAASDQLLSLPLYPLMTDAEQDDVLAALLRILAWFAA